MSESVNPSSTAFPTPNLWHTLEVPFKYLSIHLTTAQCSRLGLLIYRLTAPTSNAMFGLVQTITYIRLPTTDAYGAFLILALSFSPFRHCLTFNLQFIDNVGPNWLCFRHVEPLQDFCHIFLLWQPQHVLSSIPNYVHPQNLFSGTRIFHGKRLA